MTESKIVPQVTIIIKALNEEHRIAACLQAAVREAASVDGEVLLVDSLSTDKTVEIAKTFPVRIVQFAHVADRGCGAAVQLGYQFTRAPYLYVLDADMVLQQGFLRQALACLQADAGLAGVAGKLVDTRLLTAADQRRARQASALTQTQTVAELGGGGLYRRSAIEQVGYLSNRWLAAYEEAELGMRLRAAGWRLLRVPVIGVLHEGHLESSWTMLRRQWRNGRAKAGGALLRGALGQPWFSRALRVQAFALAVPVLHGGLLAAAALGAALGASWLASYGAAWLALLALFSARKRSLRGGAWALLAWHYSCAALLAGLWRAVRDPRLPIAARELQ